MSKNGKLRGGQWVDMLRGLPVGSSFSVAVVDRYCIAMAARRLKFRITSRLNGDRTKVEFKLTRKRPERLVAA